MDNSLLESTINFHGHLCPGTATGYRAALVALKILNEGKPLGDQYVVIIENDVCGLDGIQIVTGCTVGNDGIIIENGGKQVFRFLHKKTGCGIRVSLKQPLWGCNDPIILHEKVKIGTATPEERQEFFRLRLERGEHLLKYNDDDLFNVTEIFEKVAGKPRLFPFVTCRRCQEEVMLPWATKEGEHYVCSSCRKQEKE